MKRRAVFLDRDGVLIEDQSRPDLLPGVAEALDSLRPHFLLVMVTNQPDVARGKVSREDVETVNVKLKEQLQLDDVRACYHDDGQCFCRKPAPGMLLTAAKDLNINLAESYMIGDRWKDMEAGNRAGCKTVLIDRNYSEKTCASDFPTNSMAGAAAIILKNL
jgi:D-glycero-D-manno-heptose 1,7-bisphosphate phosphatase